MKYLSKFGVATLLMATATAANATNSHQQPISVGGPEIETTQNANLTAKQNATLIANPTINTGVKVGTHVAVPVTNNVNVGGPEIETTNNINVGGPEIENNNANNNANANENNNANNNANANENNNANNNANANENNNTANGGAGGEGGKGGNSDVDVGGNNSSYNSTYKAAASSAFAGSAGSSATGCNIGSKSGWGFQTVGFGISIPGTAAKPGQQFIELKIDGEKTKYLPRQFMEKLEGEGGSGLLNHVLELSGDGNEALCLVNQLIEVEAQWVKYEADREDNQTHELTVIKATAQAKTAGDLALEGQKHFCKRDEHLTAKTEALEDEHQAGCRDYANTGMKYLFGDDAPYVPAKTYERPVVAEKSGVTPPANN